MVKYTDNEEKEIFKNKNKLFSFSTFNLEDIAFVLEQLISMVEEESYSYVRANYKGIGYAYEEGYGYERYTNNYVIDIITKKDKAFNSYEEEYVSESGSHLLNSRDVIVLNKSEFNSKKKIHLYDEYGRKNIIINSSDYNYIYEFIDYVIDFKMTNNVNFLERSDLLKLMIEFLNNKKLEKGKIKDLKL